MAEGGGEETPIQIITVTEDQCGYCLESGTSRVDPRRLPCGHSFCLLCLELKPVRDSMYCKRHKRYPVTRAVSFNPVPWAMARLVFLSRKKLMKCHILIFKNKVEDLRN